MVKTNPRFIAFYLPQFHPIEENNLWWGPGFTEWTNVAKARPLFRGHRQPHIPADLGFYDLRIPEVREAQAQLAREAGIEGFCYWHYWFGNGRKIMEKPFQQVLETKKPDFPFCLAWANHSWYKKLWDPKAKWKDTLLVEQTYPNEDDFIAHFYYLLPAFKDERYIKVNGKIYFIIYDPKFPQVSQFIKVWRRLAEENGLKGFYFVGTDYDSRDKEKILAKGFDAIYNADIINIHHHLNLFQKIFLAIKREIFHMPTVFRYKDAINYMVTEDCKNIEVIPTIGANWDHTPRSGGKGMVLHDSNPKYFKKVAQKAIDIVKEKPVEEQIVMIKSWNEWGEGNYMEPDLEYGHGYINALKEAIQESSDNIKI